MTQNLSRITCLLPALLCLLFVACDGTTTVHPLGDAPDEEPQKKSALPAEQVVTPAEPAFTEASMQDHIPINTTEKGLGPLSPEELDRTRKRHRLDVDQLDASIRQVTGGIGWTERRGSAEINLFDDLADTLGKPDYLDSTQEDLTPNLIFLKFLNDAARQVCDRLATRESENFSTLGNARYLYITVAPGQKDTAAIDANIQELLMRFHGTYAEPGTPQHAQWRWLYDSSVHVAGETTTAWRTLCVGLMTHPDFYTY